MRLSPDRSQPRGARAVIDPRHHGHRNEGHWCTFLEATRPRLVDCDPGGSDRRRRDDHRCVRRPEVVPPRRSPSSGKQTNARERSPRNSDGAGRIGTVGNTLEGAIDRLRSRGEQVRVLPESLEVRHILCCSAGGGAAEPSDQLRTGMKRTVVSIERPSRPRTGEPSLLAPQSAAFPWGTKSITWGSHGPSASLRYP